jgi:hypothetical protein
MGGRARRATTLGIAALGLAGLCGCGIGDEPRRALPGGGFLVQKQQFQALYDANGRIVRLLQDRNHDGRAEVVVVYYPNGKPQRGEVDTDEDGVVDRWEYFRSDGSLEKVGVSRARNGTPDTWE